MVSYMVGKLLVVMLIASWIWMITSSCGASDSSMNEKVNQYRHLQDQSQVDSHVDDDKWNLFLNGNGSNNVYDKPDYSKARSFGYNTMNLIYQRYEYHNWFWYQFFLGAFNMPYRTWDMLKYKIAQKSVEHLATGKKTRFLMIFGGSSVTAGHDNYFNQSYPMVFDRRMKSTFDALGIELIVRNIAQGGNPCRPSDLCYEAMGGSNPDWLGWEQSYNCKSADIYEMMAKIAILNRAVLYFTASGAYVPDYCEYSNDTIPWIAEEWTPEKADIKDRFIPTDEYLIDLRKKLNEWFEDGNAIGRFSGPLGGRYDGAAMHGFSVWGKCSHMYQDINRTRTIGTEAYNMRPYCFEQGGPHWMSKQTAAYGVGTGFRKWHPSAGFHMLRGETLAYNYMGIVIDAINMIEADLKSSNAAALSKAYQDKLDSMYMPPPEKTMHCWNEECGTKPKCYTDFTPNYNPSSLLENIIVGKHDGWTKVMKGQFHEEKWGYLDHKPSYDTTGSNRQINFAIDVPHDHSLVMVCGTMKDCLKHVNYFLDINATNIGPDYELPANKNLTSIQHNVKYRGDECYNLWETPGGRHVLTLITDQDATNHPSCVTHIITFE